ncbi:hypothetical protein GOP47_0026353 [Adiantum capillus-veneris]|nr:hypothetical protein GOP47_0026353 [Adiantum capillus-veneris]
MEQAFDDEYQKLVWRMNPPRVVVDNESCENATVFKIDSSNRHSILLDVVQILTDLDLNIHKAYISSDGGWFMDVFHVTDAVGKKVTSEETISYIEEAIDFSHQCPRRIGMQSVVQHTTIELIGTDRPGLMSEICALLADMKCNVVSAELWTQCMRVACVLYITDEATFGPIMDSVRLCRIKESLSKVLNGDQSSKCARTDFVGGLTHTERRLHQMMYADRDYERVEEEHWDLDGKITVDSCVEKGYSVVNVESRNRAKLLFDTLCTLTDMEYVVFHATIDTDGLIAHQEYYIRHIDGCMLDSAAERQRVIQCLRAAINRRVTQGLRLELCTNDRVGLLSDVTRIFREHGLSVTRADVNTKDNKAINVFYVTDAAGNVVDLKAVEAVRQSIGKAVLQVKSPPSDCNIPSTKATTSSKLSIGSLLLGMPAQVLYSLGLIKSCS